MLATLENVDASTQLGGVVAELVVAVHRRVAIDVDDLLQPLGFGHLLRVQLPRDNARSAAADQRPGKRRGDHLSLHPPSVPD